MMRGLAWAILIALFCIAELWMIIDFVFSLKGGEAPGPGAQSILAVDLAALVFWCLYVVTS